MKERNSNTSRRTGMLNIALLFGTAAIALTLILTPMLTSRQSVAQRLANTAISDPYDDIKTGSIRPTMEPGSKPETANGKRYVIRRSILQKDPSAYCVVQGYKSDGDC